MNYLNLLENIISIYFKDSQFDLKGKLEWREVTEKQKIRYQKKYNKELKIQRRRFVISEIFSEKKMKSNNKYSFFHHILISEIENDNTFYIIDDHCVGGLSGQIFRYKFILNDKSTYNVELIDTQMIAIR